jgi:hypothetical protein
VSEKIPCPACLHEETMRARFHEREPVHDDMALMAWVPPYGGARGQQVTKWDGGGWVCQVCQLRLTPHEAGVLLDAALMHYDPRCDSIVDGVHADTRRAMAGGKVQP